MEKNIVVTAVMQYNGHTAGANGNIDLNLIGDYSELTNMIQVLQMLSNDVSVKIKMFEEKPFKLGVFRVKTLNVAGDGESKLKLNSMSDFVEVDNMNRLITKERFTVRFEANVEIEDEGEDE